MTKSNDRVVIYTRVSSEEQIEGHSLSAQAQITNEFAKSRGWKVVRVYEERGRSGKTTLRPEFQQMMRDAESGQFDILLVHKLDRFSRSLLDILVYINRLKQSNVQFVSATEPFDTTSQIGKALLFFVAFFAEWYLDNLRGEITKGKQERARQGYWNGTLSWGYTTLNRLRERLIHLGDDFKSGKIAEEDYAHQASIAEDSLERWSHVHPTAAIPCPFDSPGVVMAFTKYTEGINSDRDIATLLNAAGFRISTRRGTNLLVKDTVEDILQNRFYLGETSYGRKDGEASRQWMPGNHQALISPELFYTCQQVRARRAKQFNRTGVTDRSRAVYPLGLLVYCAECGTRLKGVKMHHQRRYRDPAREKGRECPSKHKSVPGTELEVQAIDFLLGLRLPPHWEAQIMERVIEQQPEAESIKRKLAALTAQRKRLRELYVRGEYDNDLAVYEKERDEIQRQIDEESYFDGRLVDLQRAGEMLQSLPELLKQATLEDLKAIFCNMFEEIYIREGVIIAVKPTDSMWALLETVMIPDTGRIGSHSNIFLPVKPLNSSIVYHFLNANHSRHS